MTIALTKNAHDPIKVARVEAYSTPGALMPNPSAPQSVKPRAPIQFQNPICQPSVFIAGKYHFSCVSSMNSQLEMMNPEPPMTYIGMLVSYSLMKELVTMDRFGGKTETCLW